MTTTPPPYRTEVTVNRHPLHTQHSTAQRMHSRGALGFILLRVIVFLLGFLSGLLGLVSWLKGAWR